MFTFFAVEFHVTYNLRIWLVEKKILYFVANDSNPSTIVFEIWNRFNINLQISWRVHFFFLLLNSMSLATCKRFHASVNPEIGHLNSTWNDRGTKKTYAILEQFRLSSKIHFPVL